jgi:hypothetical protein
MKKLAGFVFMSLVAVSYPLLPRGAAVYGRGDGSPADPYQITNVFELQAMNSDLGASYVLANDIDASETKFWNAGAGFIPIGSYPSAPFTGFFDGQSHVITGLFINLPASNWVGLFGWNQGNSIRNVGLVDADIRGNACVGALTGSNSYGTVENCYSSGTVNGGYYSVGGLVGWNYYATIETSYSAVIVIGHDYVGGLAGNVYGGLIADSYATGSVSGPPNAVGGLVGNNQCAVGIIKNCYAIGTVIQSQPGDLAGYGGLVGFTVGFDGPVETTTSSFWDAETSGQSASRGGSGKTTAEMMRAATFADWDFANIWCIQEGASYPYLSWQEPPPPPAEMVSYWRFDESQGPIALDSRDSNPGTLVGSPVRTAGRVGGALHFDGIDDRIDCGTGANLDIQDSVSLEAWIFPTAIGPAHQTIIVKGNYPESYAMAVTPDGKLLCGVGMSYPGRGEAILTDSALQTDTWYHVACTIRSGKMISVFINGSLVKSGTISRSILSLPNEPLRIGALYYGGTYIQLFNGLIDEVAVSKGILTPEEIKAHYEAGMQGEAYVEDGLSPVPDAATLPTVTGQCSAAVEATPTATDNVEGTVQGTTSDPLIYTAQGTFTVHWTYTDQAGNIATQEQKVIVADTIAPEIFVSAPECVPAAKGKGQATHRITVTARDNCTDNVVPQITKVEIFNNGGNPVAGNGLYEIMGDVVTIKPNGNGWSVRISAVAADAQGNPAMVQVTVPLGKC